MSNDCKYDIICCLYASLHKSLDCDCICTIWGGFDMTIKYPVKSDKSTDVAFVEPGFDFCVHTVIVKTWTLPLPLWRTTGRRRVLSTPWRGRHSRSTQPSSDADFSFLSERAWSLSGLSSVSACTHTLWTLRVTLLWFFSNLQHVKRPALIGLPNGEHVNQMGLGSVHFRHPALNLKDRFETLWGGQDLEDAADVFTGRGEWERVGRVPGEASTSSREW